MYDYEPTSEFFPRDMQRTYTLYRKFGTPPDWQNLGTYRAQRSPMQGNSNYSQDGISEQHEERINFPIDADVQISDVVQCAEDGQSWAVGEIRRQAIFRVAYVNRSSLVIGTGKASFS